MKLILSIVVSIGMLFSAGCSKNAPLSRKNNNDSIPNILGEWKATGYYSTYFMSPKPIKRWVAYSLDEQFTYEFGVGGKLTTSGKSKGCPYQHYSLDDSTHLRLLSDTCDTEKYTILKLTSDSLCLSKPWYENQYVYVFVKAHKIAL